MTVDKHYLNHCPIRDHMRSARLPRLQRTHSPEWWKALPFLWCMGCKSRQPQQFIVYGSVVPTRNQSSPSRNLLRLQSRPHIAIIYRMLSSCVATQVWPPQLVSFVVRTKAFVVIGLPTFCCLILLPFTVIGFLQSTDIYMWKLQSNNCCFQVRVRRGGGEREELLQRQLLN